MHANRQMKLNIAALLRGRHLHQKDLADWCRNTESWISKIMKLESSREFPLKYWDRIADFFGVETYQLLQPGIASQTERRKAERRSGKERRVGRKAEASSRPGFTDDSLVREVLSLPYDDRPFLFESIAALKRRRVEWPSRGRFGVASASGGESTPPVPRGPSPSRKGRPRGGKNEREKGDDEA